MSNTMVHIVAVIFPKFELLDLYGPLELFGMLGDRIKMTVVAEEAGIVASNQGPSVVADLAMREVESLDLLLVPGGWGTRKEVKNEVFLDSLRKLSLKSRYTTSVCTGSAILAKAGLLDGRRATSNKRVFPWVVSQSDKVSWIRKARWVDDGHLFTSSGVTAGMDMTLALIERLFSREEALQAAAQAEYTWNEDSTSDPFYDTYDKPA